MILNTEDRLRALMTVIVFKRIFNFLYDWSPICKLNYKGSKCVHIRFCHTEPSVGYTYTINNKSIPTRENHRDHRVMVFQIYPGSLTTTILLPERIESRAFFLGHLMVFILSQRKRSCTLYSSVHFYSTVL